MYDKVVFTYNRPHDGVKSSVEIGVMSGADGRTIVGLRFGGGLEMGIPSDVALLLAKQMTYLGQIMTPMERSPSEGLVVPAGDMPHGSPTPKQMVAEQKSKACLDGMRVHEVMERMMADAGYPDVHLGEVPVVDQADAYMRASATRDAVQDMIDQNEPGGYAFDGIAQLHADKFPSGSAKAATMRAQQFVDAHPACGYIAISALAGYDRSTVVCLVGPIARGNGMHAADILKAATLTGGGNAIFATSVVDNDAASIGRMRELAGVASAEQLASHRASKPGAPTPVGEPGPSQTTAEMLRDIVEWCDGTYEASERGFDPMSLLSTQRQMLLKISDIASVLARMAARG